MNNHLDSLTEALKSTTAVAESRETLSYWRQPSVPQMVVVGRPVPFTGKLINDVYLVQETSDDDDGLNGLVAAYDKAADEDFMAFESRLE